MAAANSSHTPSDDDGDLMMLSSLRRSLTTACLPAASVRCWIALLACSTEGGGGGRLSRADGGRSTSSSGGGGGKNSIRHSGTAPFTSRSEPVTSWPREMMWLRGDDISLADKEFDVFVATSDDFLACLGIVGGGSLAQTGDAVVRLACDCDTGTLDIGGVSLLTAADGLLGPVSACDGAAAVGGGGTIRAAGSTSMTTLLHTPAPRSDATSSSVTDGGGGTTQARYAANDGLTTASNVDVELVVVQLTLTSPTSAVTDPSSRLF